MRFTCGLRAGMASLVVSCAPHHDTSMPGCACDQVLAFVADHVQRNYAGFQDKVHDADRHRYALHSDESRRQAGDVHSEADCHRLLLEFTGWFRDPHLAVTYAGARVDAEPISGHVPARHHDVRGEFAIRALDTNTLLLRLPDFAPVTQPLIDSLIEASWSQLTSARNLIIDVRGNPGGSDSGFRSLRPLLYTGPVVTPGLSHYATDGNIQTFEAFLENANLSGELEGQVRALIATMREHRGTFVPAADDTLTIDRPEPLPDRVAVVTDRGCASSCESFVWTALQSDRVTVFGESTAGLLDYGDALPVDTPCPVFRLHSPTSRSNRVLQGNPLDNVGIDPDVRIPENIVNWVDWVHAQLQAATKFQVNTENSR